MALSDRDQADLIRALQDRYGRKVARAFLEAVNSAKGRIDWDAIAALVQNGQLETVFQIIEEATDYSPVRAALQEAVIAAGGMSAGVANAAPVTRLEVYFDPGHPAATSYLQQYELDLIRGLHDQSRATVRDVLSTGTQVGRNPLTIARDLRESLGLTDRQEQAVRNFRVGLEDANRAPKRRALRDKRFDASIDRAADRGEPPAQDKIDRMVERYRARYLKYRAEMVARTETARAISQGQEALWRQLVDSGQLRADQIEKRWIYTHDGKTRDAHVTIPSLNSERKVTLNDTFDSALGPIRFPGDPDASGANTVNCRCTVIYRLRTDI